MHGHHANHRRSCATTCNLNFSNLQCTTLCGMFNHWVMNQAWSLGESRIHPTASNNRSTTTNIHHHPTTYTVTREENLRGETTAEVLVSPGWRFGVCSDTVLDATFTVTREENLSGKLQKKLCNHLQPKCQQPPVHNFVWYVHPLGDESSMGSW